MTTTQRRIAQFIAGLLALAVAWEALGRSGLLGPTWPPLTTTIGTLIDPGRRELFIRAAVATLTSAAIGLAIGAGTALVLAAVHNGLPALRPGLDRFAGFIHAVPLIGIAPILVITVGRADAPAAVASLAAFFPAYATAGSAFHAVPSAHHDVFTVAGSSRSSRLLRLQLPTAIPGLCDALRLAAPGAVLGAILGEWFGAPQGIGLVILSSAQNYQISQLWAAALLSTSMALGIYAVFSGAQLLARRRIS